MTFSKPNTSLLVAATLLLPSVAFAQDPEATTLFEAAKALADKGQYAEACPKFEASFKKEAALGTMLNLADCHEHQGLLYHAWAEWKLALEQAKKANDGPRADLAKRHVDALEPRLPRLKIEVTGSQTDITIWRDDKQLDPAEYNTDVPIDPGERVITVRRGTTVLLSSNVRLNESAHEIISFDTDKLSVKGGKTTNASTNKDKDTDNTPSEWMQFDVSSGVHPFVGLSLLAGPSLGMESQFGSLTSIVDGTFDFDLHAGVYIGLTEIALAISPFSIISTSGGGNSFEMNATIGHLFQLYRGHSVSAYYPLRFGIGFIDAANLGVVYFEARADLIGAAVAIGHVMVNIQLPSFRYAVTNDAVNSTPLHVLTWLFGVNASYVF